jgi:putative protein-disulfide isomerase
MKKAISFASALQSAYYVKGLDLREDSVYKSLASEFGFDPEQFIALLKSEDMRQRAFNGFKHAQALRVDGYPAVLAIKNGKWYAISRGYTDYESIKEGLEKLKTL